VIAAIPSPASSGLHLGPFEVHVYGLMYAVGLLAAVAITIRRWEDRGGSRATVYDVARWGFPAGLVGGRLYFDLTSSGEVPAHWWGPFAVWDGGMGIWGGIALGTLVGIWRLRRAHVSVAEFMDAAAPALLVALYVAGYSGFRIFEESLRVDPAHHFLGLRLNFYVAAFLCLAGLAWFAYSQGWRPTRRQARRGAALMLAGGVAVLSGCGGSGGSNSSGPPGGSALPHHADVVEIEENLRSPAAEL
jgi:prolipoprotein diacylglyceryltransferase